MIRAIKITLWGGNKVHEDKEWVAVDIEEGEEAREEVEVGGEGEVGVEPLAAMWIGWQCGKEIDTQYHRT